MNVAFNGHPNIILDKFSNISNTSTTAIYARFGQDQVREALDQHAERLLNVAGLVIGSDNQDKSEDA